MTLAIESVCFRFTFVSSKKSLQEILGSAAERLNLTDPVADRSGVLGAYREFLDEGAAFCMNMHRQGAGGMEVAHLRSMVLDQVFEHLWSRTLSRWQRQSSESAPMSLMALGGYGRSELCPFSDIDIMFLYPTRSKTSNMAGQQRFFADEVLYLLWDLGLKVGHSTRNSKEAIVEARGEVQSKNALLESRLICGNAKLAAAFHRDYRDFIRRERVNAYIEQRLADQRDRRARYGGTVFMQEPDIKNGVGGLRDFQNIYWMVRLKLNRSDSDILLSEKLLRKSEHDDFLGAYDFLLRVRTELHSQNRRPTDLLNLEKQPSVALALGYNTPDLFQRVESFMRDYYRAAKTIYHFSNYLEQRLALDTKTSISFAAVIESRQTFRRVSIDGFMIKDGRISFESRSVFLQDPQRLIRLFRIRQQYRAKLDLDLTRLVHESLDLIDDDLIQSPAANKAFRSILQARGEVADTLRAMHMTGVLSRFIPDWSRLDCLVQHEYYHRYTADEHTLATISVLDKIFSGDQQDLTHRYREALESTEIPALLYLVLLLHDLGKGIRNEGHAEIGAQLSVPLLERLGLAPSLRDKVRFLIAGHLEMARFWQHYDLDDPRTIQKFCSWIGDSESLRYLYALTYCDARGTADELWNSYKEMLHTQLYDAARLALDGAGDRLADRPMISKESILEIVPGLSEEEIEAHYNLLPERYFVYHNAEEIALHLRMVNKLLHTIAEADSLGSLVPVVEWQEDADLGLAVVHIVTWDRAGLFYKLAGAFAVAGLSIVSSKALTRADHITIDTFYVSDGDGGMVKDAKSKRVFAQSLESSLLHNADLMAQIKAQAAAKKKPGYLRSDDRLRAPIPPGVDVYHELSLRRTIIEIQSTDTIGLLYRLAKSIFDHGFDITFARISTERNVAVDTFYIEPINKGQESDTEALLALRGALTAIVEEVSRMGA